MENLTFSQKHR